MVKNWIIHTNTILYNILLRQHILTLHHLQRLNDSTKQNSASKDRLYSSWLIGETCKQWLNEGMLYLSYILIQHVQYSFICLSPISWVFHYSFQRVTVFFIHQIALNFQHIIMGLFLQFTWTTYYFPIN